MSIISAGNQRRVRLPNAANGPGGGGARNEGAGNGGPGNGAVPLVRSDGDAVGLACRCRLRRANQWSQRAPKWQEGARRLDGDGWWVMLSRQY